MAIPSPLAKKTETVRNSENMSVEELKKFMTKHGFSDSEFAELLGVTLQGVRLWKSGQREISKTNTRILRLLDKHPTFMTTFRSL